MARNGVCMGVEVSVFPSLIDVISVSWEVGLQVWLLQRQVAWSDGAPAPRATLMLQFVARPKVPGVPPHTCTPGRYVRRSLLECTVLTS